MEKTGGLQRSAAAVQDPATGGSFCAGCGADLGEGRCSSCGVAKAAGGFRVTKLLNESDHARVYLAQDAAGARVALKELIFARAPDAQTIDAFEREAALLRQVSHPAIPRFVASFREGQGVGTRLYLAQEFVEGQSLAARLENHRFDEREARQVAEEVLRVLAWLHGLSPPLVHRDVKPANLIVRPDGSIALVDFGCAREVAPRGTHRATVTGTFGYMPPEALGGTLDRSADLYGLGATLVHLLSRRPPEELLWERPVSALREALNVSPAFLAFIERLTARDRASRFPSAAEALAAFAKFAATPAEGPPKMAGQTAPRTPPPAAQGAAAHAFASTLATELPPGQPASSRDRWLALAGVAVMVGALLLSSSGVFPRTPPPVTRAPAERFVPPRPQPTPPGTRPPAESPPRAEHGVLVVTLPTNAYVWLDGVRVGRGSQQITLQRPAGLLRIGNVGREPTDFFYRIQAGELFVSASNITGTVLVDDVDRGREVTVPVPASGTAFRNRTATGKLRLPVKLGYLPVSK